MATYYMRADGTASHRTTALGPVTDPAECMTPVMFSQGSLAAGSIVVISSRGGTFTMQGGGWPNDGIVINNGDITLIGEEDFLPTIDSTLGDYGIQTINNSDVLIQDLNIIAGSSYGIRATGTGTNVQIKDSTISGTSLSGITLANDGDSIIDGVDIPSISENAISVQSGTNQIVRNCTVDKYAYGTPGGNIDGIAFFNNTGFLCEDCVVNSPTQLPETDSGSAFDASGNASNAVGGTFRRCKANNARQAFAASGDVVDRDVVYFESCVGTNSSSSNFYFYETVTTHMNNCSSLEGQVTINNSGPVNFTMKNCILDGGDVFEQALNIDRTLATTLDIDNNIYYGGTIAPIKDVGVGDQYHSTMGAWQSASSQDANSLYADPLLDSSYMPDPTSPCYHAGKTVSFSAKDFKGRRFNVPPTIGAYEFTSGSVAQARVTRS